MSPRQNWIELAIICGVLILLSITGVVWDVASGLLASGVDGIMLLFVCLLMLLVFSLQLLALLKQAGLLRAVPLLGSKKAGAAKSESKPSPAATEASPQGK